MAVGTVEASRIIDQWGAWIRKPSAGSDGGASNRFHSTNQRRGETVNDKEKYKMIKKDIYVPQRRMALHISLVLRLVFIQRDGVKQK